MPEDQLDSILAQWRGARPEIDAEGMALVPRVMRLAYLYDAEMQKVSSRLGLKPRWLDALSALRRVGPPYRLPASELARQVLLTTGGMTSRIDRMQDAGLVRRRPDPNDRRGVLVELTPKGIETIDRAIDAHLRLYQELIPLSAREERTFIELLRKQTAALETTGEPEPD